MRRAGTVLSEAALVATLGLALALVANAVSPRGLRLGRNYFPNALGAPTTNAATSPIHPGNTFEATLRRLEQRGLQLADSNAVVELFNDTRYQQGLMLLIDARDDAHYQAGHIPGAWQFDHYHPERFLPAVLPACLNAQKVVVYCNGGTCDDSEFAAVMLREAGVPRESLFVYAGGISEWKASGQPLETGDRASGQIFKAKP